MSTVKIYRFDGTNQHTHDDVSCLEVDGSVVFGTPPVTFPFKVGDFVRVKRNVNVDGTEEGPMARASGTVMSVNENNKSCKVEFPGYIRGHSPNRHTRVYFLNRRGNGTSMGYCPRKHEAVSCIRLIKS